MMEENLCEFNMHFHHHPAENEFMHLSEIQASCHNFNLLHKVSLIKPETHAWMTALKS